MVNEISIEEANRLRAKAGLPPLADPASQPSSLEDTSLRARIAKSKASRQPPPKPVVQTSSLYDDDDDEVILDARKWVEQTKLKQSLKQQTKAHGSSQQKQRPTKEYVANDLAGMRVLHDISALTALNGEGTEHVLTLQDKTIDELDDADDGNGADLQSVALADAQKSSQRKRKSDENDDGDSFFTISDGGIIANSASINQQPEHHRPGHTIVPLFDSASELDRAKPPASDFYTEEEATALFRKPASKKSKPSKRKSAKGGRNQKSISTNDFDNLDQTASDAYTRHTPLDDASLIEDDDDLQRAIAAVRSRHAVVRKAEDIARQVQEDAMARMDADNNALPLDTTAGEGGEPGDLALSSTIEFVQSLKASIAAKSAQQPHPPADSVEEEEEEETGMAVEKEEEEEGETLIVKGKSAPVVLAAADPVPDIIDLPASQIKEPSVGSGLFATLSLLRQRNMLDKLSDEQKLREQQQRNRDGWLAAQRRNEAALALERQRIKQLHNTNSNAIQPLPPTDSKKRRGKADELTPQELEEIRVREQEALERKWAREYEDRMRDYKPQVALEYVDDTGRQLTTKEAYKQLSHAFHGNYSGKNKIDKVMAKRDRERKQIEMATASSTHQHGAVMENAHKKLGSAGIVLSSGNKPGLQGPPK